MGVVKVIGVTGHLVDCGCSIPGGVHGLAIKDFGSLI